uniref:Uncharacterized protein LOC108050797 isoform X2 n=1 Tax=Drosophila rhopaloa TaxID=1041015 RepID=A0A6P4FCJ5_DRORH
MTYPVTFKAFKKLIVNLQDIARELQAQDESNKTEEEWTYWYYQAFFRDPSVRKRYAFKVAPCPRHVLHKLLKDPDTETEDMIVDDEAEAATHTLPEESHGVIVEVERKGKFVFPVSFKTFLNSLNQKKVFFKITKTKEDFEKLLVDEALAHLTLKKLYNRFYMFPEKRCQINFFNDKPATSLAKLLQFGRPHNETAAKTLEKHAAKVANDKNYTDNTKDLHKRIDNDAISEEQSLSQPGPTTSSQVRELPRAETPECDSKESEGQKSGFKYPVSFKLFKSHVCNLTEIVKKMKLCDEHEMKTEEMCLRDYYKGFYSAPEMREKFICRFKPCPAKMHIKLLSFPQKHNEKNPKDLDFPIVKVTTEKPPHSCKEAVDEQSQSLSQSTMSSSGRVLPKAKTSECATEGIKETVPGTEPDCHGDYIPEKLGVKYPVSFKLFKSHVCNITEIVKQMKLCDEHKMKTEEMCLRDYYKGFYSVPEMRKKFVCRFKPCPAKMHIKLLSFPQKHKEKKSSDIDFTIVNGTNEKPPHSCKEAVDEQSQSLPQSTMSSSGRVLPKAKTSESATKSIKETVPRTKPDCQGNCIREKLGVQYPVSFKLFKSHVCNITEIVKKMKLCDEHKMKTEEMCLRDYYKGFYSVPEMRKKFVCRFKPCPAKMQQKLLSFPPKHKEKNSKDLDFPIVKGTTEKPPHSCKEAVDEQSQSLPQSTMYSSGRVLPKAKTSECATEGIKETVPRTEPDCHGDYIRKKLVVQYPVSFKLFKSQVCNLTEIVKQMKLCDEHKMKSEEMCLRDYYKGFYSVPEMRKKFVCRFKPCPAKMQQKLLSFPPKHKEENSKDLDFPIVKGTTEKPPHSCKEAVDEQSQSLPQSTMSSSGRVLPKAKTSECATEGIEETVPGTEPDSHRDCIPEKLGVKYPVSFELFKRHVSNLKEIVHNMKLCDEYKGETEEMCIKNYYKGFYATSEMREKFVCRFKPCPARMQKKLVSFPPKPTDCPNENASTEKPVDESRQVPFSIPRGNTNTTTESQVTQPNEEVAAIAKLTNKDYELTEHTIFNVLYRFPVSFLSFLHAINYDVIIEKLVSHTYRKKGLQKQKDILGNKTTCVKILYRYYRSFYYDNKIRKRFKYNFNAVPIELRSQFLELAEPISQPQNQSEAEPQLNIQHQQTNAEPEPSLSNNSTQSMDDLFAARLLELNGKQIIDVVDYTCAEQNACSVESPAATPVKEIESNSSTVTEGSRENRVTSLLNTSSAQKSEKQILLEQAKEIFFAENTPDHKLKYLICTSNGHMRSLWRILYQLTLQEFSDYTSIHNGEGLYESSEDLQLCYEHVVNLGNWPINLGVKLPFLKQLLHIKGVQLDKLDLGRLSPKIVNSWELGIYSDFDTIVEQMYTQHSRKIIDDVVQLFQQRDQLYAACWTHNEWIPQVPEITDESLNAAIEVEERVLDEISLRSLCGVESRDGGSPAEIVSIASTIDIVQEEPSCPPTQFNITNFVDMENLSLFSQATQIAADPLMSQEITDVVEASQVPETPTDSTSTPMEIVSVKNEPTFLNKQRGTINSNGCDWETIASEEQMIDLDETQNEGSSFSCFAISKPADEKEEELKAPAPLELPSGPSSSAHQGTVNLGKRLAANNGVPSKRIKLINDNVPQLRHQFPALPMAVMVRIESGANQPPDPVDKTTPQPEESDITPSQDFAAGNTLLESSNLNALLDATNVNTRKVIEEQVDTVSVRVPASKPDAVPRLHSNVVFRKLERFYYVESLTLEHIIKCRIERYVEGASYQDALVKIDDGLCNLRGPLLKTLFFQESPTLQSDVQQVLRDLGEFTYKRRWPVHKDATVDLRTRVLHVFMDVAPKFGFFRIQFDNATKEWATCSEMGRWNTETEEREISCDVTAFISPDILERMKELKDLMA